MKMLLTLAFVAFCGLHCKDVDSAPLPNEVDYAIYVLGDWEAYAPDKPRWKWAFGVDSVRQYLPAFGTVLSDLNYSYEVADNVATLDADSVVRVLILYALNDSLLEVYEPGNFPENTRYFLKRQ